MKTIEFERMNDEQVKRVGNALETIINTYKEAGYSIFDSDMLYLYISDFNNCYFELGRREGGRDNESTTSN